MSKFSITSSRREDLDEVVLKHIRALIANGELAPGDRLPPEHTLASMLSVSRPAIREAIKRLRGMGLVTVKVGVGTFISQDVHSVVSNAIESSLLLDRISAAELVEVRQVVEEAALRFAITRATAEDIVLLWQKLAELENPDQAKESFVRRDIAFHNLIAQIGKNRALERMLGMISDLLVELSRQVVILPGQLEKSNVQHRRLTEAITARNADEASSILREHLQVFDVIIEESWKRDDQPAASAPKQET